MRAPASFLGGLRVIAPPRGIFFLAAKAERLTALDAAPSEPENKGLEIES